MNIGENNVRILLRLRNAVTQFAIGKLSLEEIHAVLHLSMELLENDRSDAANLVRIAEADIEEIRFTRLLDEQRPEVIFRLDQLLDELPS